jgi:hypothetical protein
MLYAATYDDHVRGRATALVLAGRREEQEACAFPRAAGCRTERTRHMKIGDASRRRERL